MLMSVILQSKDFSQSIRSPCQARPDHFIGGVLIFFFFFINKQAYCCKRDGYKLMVMGNEETRESQKIFQRGGWLINFTYQIGKYSFFYGLTTRLIRYPS